MCECEHTSQVPDPQAWHEDVRLFRVHDDTAEGPLVGEFYLDMHPREGDTLGGGNGCNGR